MNIPSSTMKKEAISHVFPREITRAWNGSPPLTCSCRKKKKHHVLVKAAKYPAKGTSAD